jgi:hypothetical protein
VLQICPWAAVRGTTAVPNVAVPGAFTGSATPIDRLPIAANDLAPAPRTWLSDSCGFQDFLILPFTQLQELFPKTAGPTSRLRVQGWDG